MDYQMVIGGLMAWLRVSDTLRPRSVQELTTDTKLAAASLGLRQGMLQATLNSAFTTVTMEGNIYDQDTKRELRVRHLDW